MQHNLCRSDAAFFGQMWRFFEYSVVRNASYLCCMQKGSTLTELVLVIAIMGSVSALAYPPTGAWLDRLAVIRAAEDFRGFFNMARMGAVYRSSRVRILIEPDSLTAIAEGQSDSILVQMRGPSAHGVALDVSRSLVRLYPTGVGLGAANTTVTLRRGAASETLTLSRLGRLRRLR